MTITLRTVKGSELTHAELDGNFTDLDTRLAAVESGGGGGGGVLSKTDPATPCLTKTGAGTMQVKAGTSVMVGTTPVTFATATSVTMPTLTAGTDYAVWVDSTGAVQASDNHGTPPSSGAVKVGGFHYAPGGNATARSGGDTTPAINEYSIWDLKFRPACPDPRGMALVAGAFWVDIYLTGVDAITNGSSRFGVTIADGVTPPKIPAMFGGNGTLTYGSYTWFEAQELAVSFAKRLPRQQEFMAATFGVTERTANGSDPVNTALSAARTSKWGVIQATGTCPVWGDHRAGPYSSAAWVDSTESSGGEYMVPNAVLFGAGWADGAAGGSRASYYEVPANTSHFLMASRFVCDHIILL